MCTNVCTFVSTKKSSKMDTLLGSKKWQATDCLFVAINVQVECTVPTADPLLFDNYQRRRYGAKLIHKVEPCGTRSVKITAFDCTPYEAVQEYISIVNKFCFEDETEETDEV